MYKFFFLFIILFSSCVNKKDDSFYKQDKNQIYKTTSNLIGYNQNNKIDYLSLFLSSNYISVDSLYKTINYLISINDLSAAIKYAEDIIKLEPKKSKSYLNLANIYFELSKRRNANPSFPSLVKQNLEKSIELDNQNFIAYSLMGELLLASGDYQESVNFLTKSLQINYNQENTHLLLGYTFKQLKEYPKAIDCFRNSLLINPSFFEANMQLGQIYHLLKDKNAILYYDNAIKLDSKNELVLYNKALFYQDMQEWNNALSAYAELHEVNKFHSDSHYNLGFINMELELYDIAANNFSDAIYSNSSFYQAYYARGICFETLGNIKQAESDYKRAIQLNPDYYYAIDALSLLQQKNDVIN
tara:strand:+ start:2700 stop:3773 length:1074 start_codon:yes stop_codon:yes gene_type:complete